MLIAWAFATPLFAPPDEGAHVLRAAALARGDLTGTSVITKLGDLNEVEVPGAYVDSSEASACFTAKPAVTPDCVPDIPESSQSRTGLTIAGKYPPLFYVFMAMPSRLFDVDVSMYVMRMIACLISAAFFAMAFVSAQSIGRLAVFGVAAAITPMALSLASVVNPNGPEIASATALWLAAAAIARAPELEVRHVWFAGIAYVFFANMRTLSLVLAIVALVMPLALAHRGRLEELVALRVARIWGGVVAGASALALLWIVGPGRVANVETDASISVPDAITRSWRLFVESVAWFGLLEVRVRIAVFIWLVLWGLLVGLGAWFGEARDRLVLAAVFAGSMLLPIVVSLIRPAPIYATWLGRYGVPLWIGMPILSGVILATSPRAPRVRAIARRRPIAPALLILVAAYVVGQVIAFVVAAHRYAVGTNGRLLYVFDATWSAPLPHIVLAFCVAAGGAALAVRLLAEEPTPAREPSR
jgi:hypothetical protein